MQRLHGHGAILVSSKRRSVSWMQVLGSQAVVQGSRGVVDNASQNSTLLSGSLTGGTNCLFHTLASSRGSDIKQMKRLTRR